MARGRIELITLESVLYEIIGRSWRNEASKVLGSR